MLCVMIEWDHDDGLLRGGGCMCLFLRFANKEVRCSIYISEASQRVVCVYVFVWAALFESLRNTAGPGKGGRRGFVARSAFFFFFSFYPLFLGPFESHNGN